MTGSGSNTQEVLAFIREHPEGVRRRDVLDFFLDISESSADGILARLRNHNLVYNDGTMGMRGAIWFPVTHDGVREPFPTIAAGLIDELRGIHHEGHELYLARRLQEIFG